MPQVVNEFANGESIGELLEVVKINKSFGQAVRRIQIERRLIW